MIVMDRKQLMVIRIREIVENGTTTGMIRAGKLLPLLDSIRLSYTANIPGGDFDAVYYRSIVEPFIARQVMHSEDALAVVKGLGKALTIEVDSPNPNFANVIETIVRLEETLINRTNGLDFGRIDEIGWIVNAGNSRMSVLSSMISDSKYGGYDRKETRLYARLARIREDQGTLNVETLELYLRESGVTKRITTIRPDKLFEATVTDSEIAAKLDTPTREALIRIALKLRDMASVEYMTYALLTAEEKAST